MRERAELLGGTLEISSVPDKGTTVSLKMPLLRKDHAVETIEPKKLEEAVSPRI
jgi:signal transduction histidine kinase